MTSQPIRQPSASTGTRLRERTAAIRFLIAGTVLLGVTVTNLLVLVQDRSTAAETHTKPGRTPPRHEPPRGHDFVSTNTAGDPMTADRHTGRARS